MDQLLPLAVIVLVANSIEAMAGFGATIVAVTVGSLILPVERLVVLLVPLNLILSAWIVIRHWRSIQRRELLQQILPFSALGLPLGLGLFALVPGSWLKTAFGGFVVALASFDLVVTRRGVNLQPLGVWVGRAWLFAGGIVQGLYGSGGPMVVYYALRSITDKTEFRSTVSALWLILNAIVATAHWLAGVANLESYLTALQLLPAVLVGIALGEWLHKIVPQVVFRTVVMVLLLVAGLAILVASG